MSHFVCGLTIQKRPDKFEIFSREVEEIEPGNEDKIHYRELQWAATAHIPDPSYHLAITLDKLSRSHSTG